MTVPDKFRGLRVLFAGVAILCGAAVVAAPSAFAQWHEPDLGTATPSDAVVSDDALPDAVASRIVRRDVRATLGDSLFGASGELRARFLLPDAASQTPILARVLGDSVVRAVGAHAIREADSSAGFHLVVMRPFRDKVNGRIGAYRIGNWSAERSPTRASSLPDGFIQVTPENQDTRVSRHFRLRDFLTRNQSDVWPKYLVLRESLVDKLELVIDELAAQGITGFEMHVMSGFRTPDYNAQGVGAGGRASESRHQYGDAADVYLRGDKDWMPDLDGDGKVTVADARVIAQAAERVESRNPSLVGGIGVYPATSEHGPFVHIDVRGTRARWGDL